jgi:hypothetical protein
VTQSDYGESAVKGHTRALPIKRSETGNLLPQDVPPQYATAYNSTFVGHSRDEIRVGRRAGHPATVNSGYNIITGGGSLNNSAFERFENGQDYRRHR